MTVERDRCRRPITAEEVPHLLELGQVLRYWRQRVGLSCTALADELAMNRTHLWRIEAGRRRTRASTLDAIAEVIATTGRRSGVDRSEVRRSLIAAAGPALAPETPKSASSVDRKRRRKRRANVKHDLAMVRAMNDGPDAEPVQGGPLLFLLRRLNAELDRALRATV